MEPVGFAASIVTLAEIAKAIVKSLQRVRGNAQKRSHLQAKVDDLIKILESAGSTSKEAADFVKISLQEVKLMVESLAEPARNRNCVPNYVLEWIKGRSEEAKLDEAERKLECLRTEVVVVANMLQLKKDIPRIFNKRMELPKSSAGLLNRAEPILTFLKKSESQELRVIGIHGLPGIGKTTLVNYIWQEASSTAHFRARAHVQIGHEATTQLLCSLQSSILQQLGGERYEFTSPESGKQKLTEHFGQLRGDQKPVFLVIDNVFEAEDLKNLLPFDLPASLLPMSSSIAVTCRDIRVIRDLLNICHLQEENSSQVLCFTPPCLEPKESKTVFAACGDLCMDKDAELLDNFVPLCKGLPLALTVLGKIFAGNAKRKRKEWELIKEQMQSLDEDTIEMRPVTNALRLSYDQLEESHKVAFFDVVNFFYGWPWERVERILGESALKDLKDSSFVSKADDWSRCNQSALRKGFEYISENGVVTMHDLTLKFGERLRTHANFTMRRDFQSTEGLLQSLEAPKLMRNLMLWSTYPEGDPALEFLKKTTSLQVLLLHAIDGIYDHPVSKKLFTAGQYTSLDAAPYPGGLRYLSLAVWNSSRCIMEMKLSREVREINLYCCGDVKQLPDTPLHQLERLSIIRCKLFEGFSPSCVENWHKLKDLKVTGSKRITSLPAELGHLENLRSLHFEECSGLETFPSLCNAKGPSHLEISDCPRLRTLPSIACPLQRLSLYRLQITSLALEETACVLLRGIHLYNCDKLRALPPAIGNASSLEDLSLRVCESLEELPDEVGKLTSLRRLDVSECKNLKALPAGIGNASSLEDLSLSGCESLEELPDEVGKLTSLRRLDVSECKNLKALPAGIGNAVSLEVLLLSGCKSLEELPDEVGKLTSLRRLDVSWCKNLKALPAGIGNASSLEDLSLRVCESLEELPDEVGKLTSLRRLDVSGCKNLRALPAAIGNNVFILGWEC